MWMRNIKELSECYKTYALDCIWDYGRSIYTQRPKDLNDFVKWLDELFNALELGDNINLMGMSYGGFQTVQYALRFPNRLNKIVLLAPAATILSLSLKFMMYAILSTLPYRYFTKNMFYWLFEDAIKKDEASRMQIEEMIDDMFMALRCYKTIPIVKPTVLEDKELQDFNIPTLYLVGENEKIYSAEKAIQRLNNVAPHIKKEVIPSAGHDLSFVQAEMVNKKVMEFLKQS
jgi:pimeloyl-ACP methyl ester carboxylesterase